MSKLDSHQAYIDFSWAVCLPNKCENQKPRTLGLDLAIIYGFLVFFIQLGKKSRLLQFLLVLFCLTHKMI